MFTINDQHKLCKKWIHMIYDDIIGDDIELRVIAPSIIDNLIAV